MWVISIGDIIGIVCGAIVILIILIALLIKRWIEHCEKIQEKKIDIAIGYATDNESNKSFLIGQSADLRGEEWTQE